MKKQMIAMVLGFIAFGAIAAEPTMYNYKVVVGEKGMIASGVTTEGSALPVSVAQEQQFSCRLKDAFGQEQALSMKETVGTSITLIPIEKNGEEVKTALRIVETTGSNAATKLNANCAFPEGTSSSATISKVAVLALGKPQSFTLPNGSTVSITATLAK